MAKATHKPPAQIRYEQSHPNVSFRVSTDVYALLKQRLEDLGGISFADFIKDSLGVQQLKMPDVEQIREKAWSEAYVEAVEQCKIWYFCSVCGKQIYMEPNSDCHKAMIRYMKNQGWSCPSCKR